MFPLRNLARKELSHLVRFPQKAIKIGSQTPLTFLMLQ